MPVEFVKRDGIEHKQTLKKDPNKAIKNSDLKKMGWNDGFFSQIDLDSGSQLALKNMLGGDEDEDASDDPPDGSDDEGDSAAVASDESVKPRRTSLRTHRERSRAGAQSSGRGTRSTRIYTHQTT